MPYKRKYIQGELITNLDELSKQFPLVWIFGKPYNVGWLFNMQFRVVSEYLRRKMIYSCVKITEEGNSNVD